MATTAQAAEKVTDLLQNLKVDPGRGDRIEVPSNPDASIQNATSEASVADATNIPVAYEAGMDAGMYYAVNGFAAPHGYYYGGFECGMGDWEDYMRHVSADGLESQNLGVYSENGPLLYHPSSYGYGPQHVYGPYTPGAPIPPMRPDGQFYAPQGYPYSGHVYQPPAPPNAPFVPPSSAPTGIAAPAAGTGESTSDSTAPSGNSGASGTWTGHVLHSSGPTGRGILPVNASVSGISDVRAGPPWLNYSKMAEVQPKHGLSQAISVSGQGVRPVAPLMPHIPSGHHYRTPPAVAATPGTLGRAFQPPARVHRGPIAPGRAADTLGTSGLEPRGNAHNWIAFDKGKPWGRGNLMTSNGGSNMDVLNEQNRGPRTTRMRNQRVTPSAVRYMPEQGATNGTPESVTALANKDHYNHPDFATNYDNAKFFIIKSYSEDDIHKSIKYGVWASTVNGNKKLDAAYQEAQASSGYCPLFLFFSVNASGQFCGVAEMVGPVDFNKSLDFWQQDKWSGKLPVKWHIVKDVPNNQFRHIILENNDNKPVTNSRDTQEVRFDQGVEMLTIFKNFVFKTSILDDFQFYENRQKAMQEKRARQQAYFQLQRVAYRDNKDLEQRSSREDAPSTLQKGGRPVEALGQGEKSVKLKDGHAGSITADECNGISAEEKRVRQQAYLQLQQVVFRESKDLQQKSSREETLGILQKGGRSDEAVEKPVKLKDGHLSSNVSEKCNGTSSDEVLLDRSLSRSESRDSKAGGVESLLSTKDTVSVSGKSISELSGKI